MSRPFPVVRDECYERYVSFGGFEAMWTRRHRGLRALASQLPGQAWSLVRGLSAVATVFTPVGWAGGDFGLRLQDYRHVTSESVSNR